ncbi:MAG: glycerophosphodiester phosphodiesterase [Lactobacillus sp.]|jgi:glycerophosphoryl diester phosphodiesterase|nr:glycerophosphodiester phosphodiesterase [Lactobacillus sp.]
MPQNKLFTLKISKYKFSYYLPIFFSLAIFNNLMILPIWKNIVGWIFLQAGRPLDSAINIVAVMTSEPWIIPALVVLVGILLAIIVWQASWWLQERWSWRLAGKAWLGAIVFPSLAIFFRAPLLTQNKLLPFLIDHLGRNAWLSLAAVLLLIIAWVIFLRLNYIPGRKFLLALLVTAGPVFLGNCFILFLQKLFEHPATLAINSTLVNMLSQFGLCLFLILLSPQPHEMALPTYVTSIIIGAAFISCLLVTPQPHKQTPLVIAHRGASQNNDLQNSIAALRKTAKLHPDYIEIDVHETKDHQFVVLHDENLSDLAGIDRKPHDMTLQELQQLKIHDQKLQQTGHLASLDQYLRVADKLNQPLLIDIKTTPFDSANMLERFERTYGYRILANRDLVQSLDYSAIKQLHALKPYYLQSTNLILPPKDPAGFAMSYSVLTTSFVSMAQRPVFAWTANRPLAIKGALSAGGDGIITDNVPLAKKLAAEFTHERNYSKYLANLIFNPYA